MRNLSYDQQTANSANPLARYAHRKRMSLALKLVALHCPNSATVVDFGAGPGLFLHVLGEGRPDIKLVGYDPFVSPDYAEVRYTESLHLIAPGSVDVLTAFEVCEHLYSHELENLLADAARMLRPGGTLVISVPIMYGFAVVPKVLNWMIRGRTLKTDYTGADVLRSAVGIRVSRPENPRFTHKGFDFRELRKIVAAKFQVHDVYHSPVRFNPWWLSSQYFMICRSPV